MIRLLYFTKSYEETEKLNDKKAIKKPSKQTPKKVKYIAILIGNNIQIIYFPGILKVIFIMLPIMFSIRQTPIICGIASFISFKCNHLFNYMFDS